MTSLKRYIKPHLLSPFFVCLMLQLLCFIGDVKLKHRKGLNDYSNVLLNELFCMDQLCFADFMRRMMPLEYATQLTITSCNH